MWIIILYVCIFIINLSIHLYGCHKNNNILRAVTKPIILLSVLGTYLECMHLCEIEPSLLVVLALLFSWIGDVLLLPQGTAWFIAGGISFWISHFIFIAAYIEAGINFSNMNIFLCGLIVILYVSTTIIAFSKLKKSLQKELFVPMFLYFLTNATMNIFAWFRVISASCSILGGIITGIGATLFYISDMELFFVCFDEKYKNKSHFKIMLTYSVGEFLIALGFIISK